MADQNTELVFATTNKGKLEEARAILRIKIKGRRLHLPEIQGSPEEIVKAKLYSAYEKLKKPVIVEDTSLYIKGLGGLPGPYIKGFLERMGTEGLSRLAQKSGNANATASCIFGYRDKNRVKLFKGEIKGRIVNKRGNSGFGWDPIFQPIGYNKTFAEIGSAEKNKISHRKLALEKMRVFFEKA